MRRLFIVLTLLFLFPVLSAVEIDMKTDFSKGETLIAKISGNFFEAISEEDISFFRGHVKTSIIPFVTKIDGDFYIYAQLFGKNQGNYSIVIEDTKYFELNKIIEGDLVRNFSINEKFADFSVEPGFKITNEDFSLSVKNLIDNQIIVNVETDDALLFGISTNEDSVNLKTGETRGLDFEVENNASSLNIIKLSTENLEYNIPVFIFSTSEKESNGKKGIVFEQSVIDLTIATDSEAEGIIRLKNTGDTVLENISLILSDSLIPYISLSLYGIDELEGNSSKKINVHFSSDEDEMEVEGQITASSEEFFAHISVFLNFIPDYIPLDEIEKDITGVSQSCFELGGVVCTGNQECLGESDYSNEGVCCLGVCNEIQESSTGKIIGWTMIFVIIIFVVLFYLKKYKGTKRVVDLLKIERSK